MSDIIKKLSEPLTANDIDFRVQSINKGGYATILAYKDARVDINRLNAVCGMNWKREHSQGNHNCTVSIWNDAISQWVSREDTGTESFTEAAKGLASDSFKRACFNWGVGIELYDYPVIQIKLNGGGNSPTGAEWYLNEQKKDKYGAPTAQAGYELKLREWQWRVDVVDRVVTYLAAKDQKGDVRFYYGSAARKSAIENASSIDAIKDALAENKLSFAAEAWFEMSVRARTDVYVSEKHGGVFNPSERKLMQDEFMNYFTGSNWSGLFSEVN